MTGLLNLNAEIDCRTVACFIKEALPEIKKLGVQTLALFKILMDFQEIRENKSIYFNLN